MVRALVTALLVLSLWPSSACANLGQRLRIRPAPPIPADDGLTQIGVVPYADGAINVRAFGAVGDGVTDDTVAIQAAIDACIAAGGGTVYFPPGHYLCTVTVEDRRVWFQGAGPRVSTLEAVKAGEYTLTNAAPTFDAIRIDGLRFVGAGRTKNGLGKIRGTGGISGLWVTNCSFRECDRAFHAMGTFWWQFSMCTFSNNNYDWYAEGLENMQTSTFRIEHCYSMLNQIASLRIDGFTYHGAMVDGVVENTQGFVVHAHNMSDSYPLVIDRVHLEGNCRAAMVDIDGVPTVPYEFYFGSIGHAILRGLHLSSLSITGGSNVLLDGSAINADAWRFASDGSPHAALRAINGLPYSGHTTGNALNDVYHESRRVTGRFSRVQVAPGPLTDRLTWQRTNLFHRGSMAHEYAVASAGANSVGFSSAYDAPIHGRCMTIDFSSPNQARTDGVRLFPDYAIRQNKWYVWSLDLRSVEEEGYLHAMWRPNVLLPSSDMRAYPDRWTRYWGIARYSDTTTGSAQPWVWNAHPTANPTFLLANLQLVEFDTADEAEKFINEAAYCPDAYYPRPTFGAIARTAGYTATTAENGKRFSNAGATGSVTFVLPPSALNLEFEFVRVDSHPVYIAPHVTDSIRGGGPGERLVLDTDGGLVRLGCFKKGVWDMIRVVRSGAAGGPFPFEP
jgi:hypothetical protein